MYAYLNTYSLFEFMLRMLNFFLILHTHKKCTSLKEVLVVYKELYENGYISDLFVSTNEFKSMHQKEEKNVFWRL